MQALSQGAEPQAGSPRTRIRLEMSDYLEMSHRRTATARTAPATVEASRRRQGLDFDEAPPSRRIKASDPDAIKESLPNECDVKIVFTKNTKTEQYTNTAAFLINEAGNEPAQIKALRQEEFEKKNGGEPVTK